VLFDKRNEPQDALGGLLARFAAGPPQFSAQRRQRARIVKVIAVNTGQILVYEFRNLPFVRRVFQRLERFFKASFKRLRDKFVF
jgi:hypothetical protein